MRDNNAGMALLSRLARAIVPAGILLVSLVLWSGVAAENEYRRGNRVCTDKSEEYYRQDSEDLHNQDLYASCLVIKGEDAKGLAMLYYLADHKGLVTSSYFLADYLETDGRFESSALTKKNINETLKYHIRTLALIELIPTYPEPDYWAYERQSQYELNSRYAIPSIYLSKYESGAIGDYREHLLQSPSYQGDRNKETYPKYNSYMLDSLDNVVRYAGGCASLPDKRHFNPARYRATVTACRLLEELALTLIPLEEERQSILLQPRCEDLNRTNCPEYYEAHQEIADLIGDFTKEESRIFEPVVR